MRGWDDLIESRILRRSSWRVVGSLTKKWNSLAFNLVHREREFGGVPAIASGTSLGIWPRQSPRLPISADETGGPFCSPSS